MDYLYYLWKRRDLLQSHMDSSSHKDSSPHMDFWRRTDFSQHKDSSRRRDSPPRKDCHLPRTGYQLAQRTAAPIAEMSSERLPALLPGIGEHPFPWGEVRQTAYFPAGRKTGFGNAGKTSSLATKQLCPKSRGGMVSGYQARQVPMLRDPELTQGLITQRT